MRLMSRFALLDAQASDECAGKIVLRLTTSALPATLAPVMRTQSSNSVLRFVQRRTEGKSPGSQDHPDFMRS